MKKTPVTKSSTKAELWARVQELEQQVVKLRIAAVKLRKEKRAAAGVAAHAPAKSYAPSVRHPSISLREQKAEALETKLSKKPGLQAELKAKHQKAKALSQVEYNQLGQKLTEIEKRGELDPQFHYGGLQNRPAPPGYTGPRMR